MDNTSRVYIKTDDQGRIIRCEGEYTLPSNLDGWVLIEEGPPCDRLNLAQTHYFEGGLYQSWRKAPAFRHGDISHTLLPRKEILRGLH